MSRFNVTRISKLIESITWDIFRIGKFRKKIINLNSELIIYENDKFAILRCYKDDFIKKYFKNIFNSISNLIVCTFESIIVIVFSIFESLIEIISAILESMYELIGYALELIFKILSFLPVIMIKSDEKLVIDSKSKEDII